MAQPKKKIQLWFVRHGESHNNAILKSAGGLGTVLYPVKHDADPYLTEKGEQIAKRNGELVKAAKIKFDLVLSSIMVRTIQTAFHMLISTGVAEKIWLAPFISETPMSWGGIKLSENIPLPRLKQIEKLGRKDGSAILDSFDWGLIGGPKGSNEECLPPDGRKFLSWLLAQDILAEIESQHESDTDPIRIAVVTHSHFLRDDSIKLGFKPDNVDIWTANLHRISSGDNSEDVVTFTDVEGWYQEKMEVKKQEVEKDINKTSKKKHVKEKKYNSKIEKHANVLENLTEEDLEDEEKLKLLKKSKHKIKKYEKKIVKKNAKYGQKLEELEQEKEGYLNPSDIAIAQANKDI